MKKISSLLLISLYMVQLALAQIPQGINYQCVVRDISGQPVVSSLVKIRFSVLQGIGGQTVYSEEHSTSTNPLGIATAVIGRGTPITGTFSGIDWSTGNKFLNLKTDVGNTGSFADMGTTELVSVPYALLAKRTTDGNAVQTHSSGFFTTAQRDTDVLTGDSLVVAEAGTYLTLVDAEGYGVAYNFVTTPYGDNQCYLKMLRSGGLLMNVPLHDYKKDEGYPTGAYNLTGRQTTKVATLYFNQGDVIRSAVHIGTYGTTGTNTSPMGYLSYELTLVKLN